ncbi:MAG: glutathione transferase GstA [Deltaproteobacteria bacterium]|nr:glutathione transferase GstA [Deltaproteobacteria bacterium]
MKLYFSQGACSLAPHIALREAGATFDLVAVDLKTKKYGDDQDYREVNPKGYVPALGLDEDNTLTEVGAILLYLAEAYPSASLAPPAGTMGRYRLYEWLSYISSEIHKGIGTIFYLEESARGAQRAVMAGRLAYLDGALANSSFVLGAQFSVADAYLFTVLRWTRLTGIDLAPYPSLQRYMTALSARPSVVAAIAAERPAKASA